MNIPSKEELSREIARIDSEISALAELKRQYQDTLNGLKPGPIPEITANN